MEGVRRAKDGVLIDIAVSPNAGRERIKNYDPWRGRINVEMKEKPAKFRVNRELIEFFSQLFGVSTAQVHIVAGEKNPHKTIKVEGVSYEEAERVIGRYLGKGQGHTGKDDGRE